MKKIAITQKVNPALNNNIQNTNQMSPSLMQKEVINVKINILKLWNIVPFFIKILSLSTIILYILNIFFNDISFYLSNIPFYTIFHYQLWRIASSFLITTNIYNVILVLIFWTREGSSMETRVGTIKYIIIFIRNNMFIQIIYTTIISLISFLFQSKNFMKNKIKYVNKSEDNYTVNNCGLWPFCMCEVTLLCMCNPNTKVKFLFIPFEFKAKYYPIIWLILFILVNNLNYNNDIEVLCGVLFALIYQYYLRFYLNISDVCIQKFENCICCKWMSSITGFVSVNHITNKFMGEISKQRISVNNMNKINNRKKIKKSGDNIERNIKIASEYSNRNESSMISTDSQPSLLDTSFGPTKPFP